MNVCLSTHLAASLENAAVGEVTMQGAHPEPKWCAGETGLLCRATDCSGNELLVRKWTLLGAVEQFCVGFETRSEQAGEHLSLGGEQLLGLAQLPAMLQACSGHAMPYSSRWGVSSGSLQTLWLCQQVGLAPQRGLCACCVLLAAKHPCVGGWCWERMLPEMCVVGASCCHIAHPKWVYERELGGNSSFFNLSYNLTLKIFLFSEAASTWEMNKQSLQKLLWVFVCVLAENQEFLCLGQSVILAFCFFLFFFPLTWNCFLTKSSPACVAWPAGRSGLLWTSLLAVWFLVVPGALSPRVALVLGTELIWRPCLGMEAHRMKGRELRFAFSKQPSCSTAWAMGSRAAHLRVSALPLPSSALEECLWGFTCVRLLLQERNLSEDHKCPERFMFTGLGALAPGVDKLWLNVLFHTFREFSAFGKLWVDSPRGKFSLGGMDNSQEGWSRCCGLLPGTTQCIAGGAGKCLFWTFCIWVESINLFIFQWEFGNPACLKWQQMAQKRV